MVSYLLGTRREGKCFDRGKKEVGRALSKQRAHGFHWLSPCQENSGVFLPVGCAIVGGCESSCFHSQLYLIEVSIY